MAKLPRSAKRPKKKGAAKRSAAYHASSSASRDSSRNGAIRKAASGTVVIRPGAKPSRGAQEAVDALSAGVQAALARLASRRIPAVVQENGQLIFAVPRKVGGRYVVQPPSGTERTGEKSRRGRRSKKRT